VRIRIATVAPDSPASAFGLRCGDEIDTLAGVQPWDVLDYARLAADPDADAVLGDGRVVPAAALAGAVLDDAVFDGVKTCDNHCSFCFIYQLPKGMRTSLYLKDDDYRLSAMYGNFTTLTRFTEADLERVVDERISPLHVSIHATDPAVRASMLRNPKGAVSLRWLRAVLDAGIEVHGQIVCCPGVNDGAVLDQTLADLLAGYPELSSVGVVPLGVSRFNSESGLQAPTREDAASILDAVHAWQSVAGERLGRRFVFAADELYLLAGMPFPPSSEYEGFPQYENGIGMAAALQAEVAPASSRAAGAPAWGYRAERARSTSWRRVAEPVAILTGELGARVIGPLVETLPADVRSGLEIVAVANRYFGGNIGVTGLLTGRDLAAAVELLAPDVTAVIPDVVLHEGRTLDDWTVDDLSRRSGRKVAVVTADAAGLAAAAGL